MAAFSSLSFTRFAWRAFSSSTLRRAESIMQDLWGILSTGESQLPQRQLSLNNMIAF